MGRSATVRIGMSFLAMLAVLAAIILTGGYGPPIPDPRGPPTGALGRVVPIPAPDPRVARGAELYLTYCQACHGDRNGIGRIPAAPPHNQDGHTWHHSDRNLVDIILNGSGEMGDMMRGMMGVPEDAPRMPAWKATLSEDDVRAVLAFTKTWWTPEQRRMQEQSPMMR